PKRTRISYKTSKFQQRNSKLFSPFKSPLLKTKKSSSGDQQQSLQLSRCYIQENRLHNMRDDSIIAQNCPEIKKPFETITSNIILQIPPTEKPITLNLNLTFGK
ncbi:43445_t:CDS:2, partial [Gigaspora margarita]